jgi:hypothetical protein
MPAIGGRVCYLPRGSNDGDVCWVPERGSANLLGRDVRSNATSSTHEHLEQLFNEEIVNRSLRELVRESCENSGQFKEH